MEYCQPPLDLTLTTYRTVVIDGISWPVVVPVSAHDEGPLGLSIWMDVAVTGRGATIHNVTLPRLHFLNLDALWPTILMAAHHGLIEYAVPTRELAETKRGPVLAKHIRAAASRLIFTGFDEGDQTAADGIVAVYDALYWPEEKRPSDLAKELGFSISHIKHLLSDGRRRQRAATATRLKERSDPNQLALFGGVQAVKGEQALLLMEELGVNQSAAARLLGRSTVDVSRQIKASSRLTAPW